MRTFLMGVALGLVLFLVFLVVLFLISPEGENAVKESAFEVTASHHGQ